MKSARVVVLYCGARRVALGVFTLVAPRPRCERFEVFPLALSSTEPSASTAAEGLADALRRAAERAVTSAPGSAAVLVPPVHDVLVKHFRLPPVRRRSQRERMLRFEIEQQLPVPVAEAHWATMIAGDDERGQNILLAAIKTEKLVPLVAVVESVGLRLDLVAPATRGLLKTLELLQSGGGDRCVGVATSTEGVQVVQREPGRCGVRAARMPASVDSTTPSATTESEWIAAETLRTTLYFQRTWHLTPATRVILLADEPVYAEQREHLARKLQLPVENIDWRHEIGSAQHGTEGAAYGEFAAMIGAAALSRMGRAANLDLRPSELRQRATVRKRRPWLVAGIAVALVVPGFFLVRANGERRAWHRRITALEGELQLLRRKDADQRVIRERVEVREGQIRAVEELKERRGRWQELLRDLEERFSADGGAWLTALRSEDGTEAGSGRIELVVRFAELAANENGGGLDPFQRVEALQRLLGESPFFSRVEIKRLGTASVQELEFALIADIAPSHSL